MRRFLRISSISLAGFVLTSSSTHLGLSLRIFIITFIRFRPAIFSISERNLYNFSFRTDNCLVYILPFAIFTAIKVFTATEKSKLVQSLKSKDLSQLTLNESDLIFIVEDVPVFPESDIFQTSLPLE